MAILHNYLFNMQISTFMTIIQVTRGHNNIADGLAGASNPHPHPKPPPHSNIFPQFNSMILDGPTDGPTDQQTDGQSLL